jgi:hypothetical protein
MARQKDLKRDQSVSKSEHVGCKGPGRYTAFQPSILILALF